MRVAAQAARSTASKDDFTGSTERFFDAMLRGYDRSIGWALNHQQFVMLILIMTIAVNVYLYINVPKGIFPAAGYRPD